MTKVTKKEYTLERSPFYKKGLKLRATLKELKASDGEDVVLARKRYFKQDEYIKLIINDELNITAYHTMSSMAKTILQYILYYCIEYNTPSFRFKATDFADIIKSDTSVIFKGLSDLIDLNYIARTKSREVYWINHNMFYKGNFMVDKYLVTKK